MSTISIVAIAIPALYGFYWAYNVGISWCLHELPNTSLGLWNYCLCQWLWFRIAREYESGSFEVRQGPKQTGWAIIIVAPLTGWDSTNYWPRKYPYFHLCNTKARDGK